MIIRSERPSRVIDDPRNPTDGWRTLNSLAPIGRVIMRAVVPTVPSAARGAADTRTVFPSGVMSELRMAFWEGIATARYLSGVGAWIMRGAAHIPSRTPKATPAAPASIARGRFRAERKARP